MADHDQQIPKEILAFAEKLAQENAKAEKAITHVFLAPATERVLLVEVDPSGFPNDEGRAFPLYFRAAPAEGVPFPSGVVIVTEEEKQARIPLPEAWGSWDQLTLIWERGNEETRPEE